MTIQIQLSHGLLYPTRSLSQRLKDKLTAAVPDGDQVPTFTELTRLDKFRYLNANYQQ